MLTTNDDSSTSTKKTPILVNEDNVIQTYEDFKSESTKKAKEQNKDKSNHKKSTSKSIVGRSTLYPQEVPFRKSLSIAKSNVINVSIPDRQEMGNQAQTNTNSFQSNEQKYNLELFKKRTKKNSNRVIGKSGLKWNILSTDQNYPSNLPLIGKTRTNFKDESWSLDQLSSNSMIRHSKNKNSFGKF